MEAIRNIPCFTHLSLDGLRRLQTVEPAPPLADHEGPAVAVATAVQHEALLSVRSAGDDLFAFSLRSRVGAVILSGVLHAPQSAAGAVGDRIAALCAREECLRIAQLAEGFVVELCDESGVIGRTRPAADRPLAHAMLRLVMTQAKVARRTAVQ